MSLTPLEQGSAEEGAETVRLIDRRLPAADQIYQMLREEIENAESDEAHGHCWVYSPDSCLLDLFDPQGSEERWRREFESMQVT